MKNKYKFNKCAQCNRMNTKNKYTRNERKNWKYWNKISERFSKIFPR